MKLLPPTIGLLLLALPAATAAATNGATYGLYERMLSITEQEETLENLEDETVTYLTRLMDQEGIIPEGKTPADMRPIVLAATEQGVDDFCARYRAVLNGCPDAYRTIRDWATDLLDTQNLATDLLAIASGYETGVSGGMGELFSLAERFLGIRHIWTSRDDLLAATDVTTPVRAAKRPEAADDGMFDLLSQTLQAAGSGAVWRYRYGITPLLRQGPCADGGGVSELFDVTMRRWCALESVLVQLRDTIPADPLEYSPALQRGEVVIFPARTLITPPHVVVWMLAHDVGGTLEREVGLGWDLGLWPALPHVLPPKDSPSCDRGTLSDAYCAVVERYGILPGGLYADPPEEPEPREGTCNLPFGRDGYLCRPLRHDRCGAELPRRDARTIVLTECKPARALEPVGLTQSGPDTCRSGWWRVPSEDLLSVTRSPQNPDFLLPQEGCAPCRIQFTCADSCPGGAAGATSPKNDRNVVQICLARGGMRSETHATVVHELVHAQQECGLKSHAVIGATREQCCATEAEAHTASCRILAEEGVLDMAGVSMEECTGAGANVSCARHGAQACSGVGSAAHDRIRAALRLREENGEGTAPSCDALAANWIDGFKGLDTRILSMIEGVNGACTPGCRTAYDNTIGGNLCYLGQCIEQSVEENRIIPGRMAAQVQDESFPWDSCAAEDQRLGRLTRLPALSPPVPPPYNPRLLVESLDLALCQINGLPALTPPVLCSYDDRRRITTPAETYAATLQSTEQQLADMEESSQALQRMTQSIATRIGTDLLTQYLHWAGAALADTVRAGNWFTLSAQDVTFPSFSCPRKVTDLPAFCSAASSAANP